MGAGTENARGTAGSQLPVLACFLNFQPESNTATCLGVFVQDSFFPFQDWTDLLFIILNQHSHVLWVTVSEETHHSLMLDTLQLCFLAIPSIVKEFDNCANQLLKSNQKVVFRGRIFSVISSSRLLATLDLAFLSYRIQVLLCSLLQEQC